MTGCLNYINFEVIREAEWITEAAHVVVFLLWGGPARVVKFMARQPFAARGGHYPNTSLCTNKSIAQKGIDRPQHIKSWHDNFAQTWIVLVTITRSESYSTRFITCILTVQNTRERKKKKQLIVKVVN